MSNFEGTEKKLEIMMRPGAPSLRSKGKPFWSEIVALSHATILSTLGNTEADAYLLSESSLFVHDDRCIMITCGRTTLIEAALELTRRLGLDSIRSLIYERKNENFPGLQPSTFDDDVMRLNAKLPGTSMRFGDPKGHHVSLYHLDRNAAPDANDVTLEILMYGLDPKSAGRFSGGDTTRIRTGSGILSLLAGEAVDDHAFDPEGYSLNALEGPTYATVHVTPEEAGSYASFETNRVLGDAGVRDQVQRAIEVFRPQRMDVILFQRRVHFGDLGTEYPLVMEELRHIGNGYNVQFCHFARAMSTSGHAIGDAS